MFLVFIGGLIRHAILLQAVELAFPISILTRRSTTPCISSFFEPLCSNFYKMVASYPLLAHPDLILQVKIYLLLVISICFTSHEKKSLF